MFIIQRIRNTENNSIFKELGNRLYWKVDKIRFGVTMGIRTQQDHFYLSLSCVKLQSLGLQVMAPQA